ncbi:MAG: methyltransferase domain-containing protein [Planctomycetes bacterium]|nr:methyltransferase domain-containing protein [Planctomycetota bacterium]
MLARAWFPLQSWCRRHPWAAGIPAVALIAVAAALGHPIMGTLTPVDLIALGVVLSAAAICARSPATWLAVVASSLVGVCVGTLLVRGDTGTSSPNATSIAVGSFVALIPLLAGLGATRADSFASTVSRGTSFAVVSAQVLAAGSLPQWPASVGILIAVGLGCLWIPAATNRWALAPGPHANQPRALPLEVLPHAKSVLWSRVAVALLIIGAVMQEGVFRSDDILQILAMVVIWGGATGQWGLAVVVVALTASTVDWSWKIAEIASGTPVRHAASGMPTTDFLVAVAGSQTLALVTWWGRDHGRLPLRWCAPACTIAAMALSPNLAGTTAVLVASLVGWLTVTAWVRRDWLPSSELAGSRRMCAALATLSPYWRFYMRGKLRGDPVYGQLAADTGTWGRVLDAGCGPGLVAALSAVRPDVSGYCGVDLDEDKLEIARRVLARLGHPLNDRWELLKGRLPFPQQLPPRFDTVMLLDVLHYWPAQEQAAVLAQLRAALRPGGRLFLREGIAVDAGDAGSVAACERFTTRFGFNPDTGTLCFITAEEMERMLVAAGFVIEERIPSGGENRLWRCAADSPSSEVRGPTSTTENGPQTGRAEW